MTMSSQKTSPKTPTDRRLQTQGPVGKDNDWNERYILCEHLVDPELVRPRQRFEGVARYLRDLLAERWIKTRQTREQENPKRVYYLSMEFLIGRTLANNIINLMAETEVRNVLEREGIDIHHLAELEPDAG